jgi:hypothetical protein
MGSPGGDLPAVAGELAGDRDRDDPVGFAPRVFELAPAESDATQGVGATAVLIDADLSTDRLAPSEGGKGLTTGAGCPKTDELGEGQVGSLGGR